MRRNAGLTYVEILVALAIVVLLIAMLLPSFGSSRGPHRQMQNNTQVRGIHQSMVMYAQGNKSKFPGIDIDGNDADLRVEARMQVLLEGNYFTGEYAVSPSETRTYWTTGVVTTEHYSYAMLQVPSEKTGRRAEWAETLNTEAVVVGDRAKHTGGRLHSVHTEPDEGWRGSVAYNDNHVVFESTHELATKYGVGDANKLDDLFTAAGDYDALLVHSGNR